MFSLLLLVIVGPAPDSAGYWQQRVSYVITASLDEPTGVLTGRATIGYVNQSPDTLRDFSVHQHLNAFRPGSRWAAADSAEERVRFQRLGDPDHAFERITAATVMGVALRPSYPFAPDSTIATWTLPRALPPGDSMTVEIAWQARPSTLPRRQGRAGRRFDFAQWYPKVVVYDRYGWQAQPLYPAGEFYGEFASYDVTLDLAADQVIGATGVPVEGDPGWERAKADPNLRVDHQRDWYGAPRTTHRCGTVGEGRKCVRFFADSVHHFAFSLNPEYIYEEGRYDDVTVRALYLPADRVTWGGGVAVGRTVAALAWLDTLFGKFPWPQITNVHRIEGGGTEFPMIVMNGGASLGLIVHEVGHNYTMGILANNEWREGWLDEGFTSFQSGWFFEARGEGSRYRNLEGNLLYWDLERWSEPVSLVSDRYRDFATYGMMVYSKAHLFFEQLRYVVGDDSMRRILRTFYARWRLKHVDEAAFRAVAEDVSGMALTWLFGQWLHGTPLIDYELAGVERTRLADDRWRTVVTIRRRGDGVMPVEIGDAQTIYARASGQPEVERIEFVTTTAPGRLLLDPRFRAHDWNALNNRERRIWGRAARQLWIDNPMLETSRRDRLVTALFPLAWSNDAGGPTFALRVRESYLGRFEKNLFVAALAVGDSAPHRGGLYVRLGNPVRWPTPRIERSVAGWWLEGRAGAALSVSRDLRRHVSWGAEPHAGVSAIWMATTDLAYLDRRLWDDAGTIEGGPWVSTAVVRGAARWRARLDLRGGLVYRFPGAGVVADQRYDVEPFGRMTGEISVRTPVVGARVFAGAYLAEHAPPLQRRIMLAGADPYETFGNPLLRSRGALFVREGFHYQAPGDGPNLRAFRPDLGGRWAVGVNLEGTVPLWRRRAGLVYAVELVPFVDFGVVDPTAVPASPAGRGYTTLFDAGIGLVTRHALGNRTWVLRFDVPAVVNRWEYAADRGSETGALAFRWQVSLQPSF